MKNVVLATDGSEAARAAERFAAENLDPGSVVLHVLSVHEEIPGEWLHPSSFSVDLAEYEETIQQELSDQVDTTVQTLEERGFTVERETRIDRPGPEICNYAEEVNAAQIIMGRRGMSGVREMLLGSVSQYVIHHAPCPVTIVPLSDE